MPAFLSIIDFLQSYFLDPGLPNLVCHDAASDLGTIAKTCAGRTDYRFLSKCKCEKLTMHTHLKKPWHVDLRPLRHTFLRLKAMGFNHPLWRH